MIPSDSGRKELIRLPCHTRRPDCVLQIMNKLKVGFDRKNIDPPLGIPVLGYYKPRLASAILSSLYVNVLALSTGEAAVPATKWNPDTGEYEPQACADAGSNENVILMLSIDCCEFKTTESLEYREYISEKTGVPLKNIFLHTTHTHTGPFTTADTELAFEGMDEDMISEYSHFIKVRMADASNAAIKDLKPAKMGFIIGQAPERVAYIRRYKMKDGSTWTCPPINDPNIDHAIGTLDQRVNVIRFEREGADSIALVNYGLHPDCLNLDEISADWPGYMADTFEAAYPGVKVIYFNGCQGDVGSTHVWPEGGDMNDTLISFDNEMKSPGMAKFVGRALAGTILQVYDKAEFVDVEDINAITQAIEIPLQVPDPKDIPLARKYKELHDAGRDAEIPYTAMELTTVVAEATRMLNLEHGPESFNMNISGVRLGPVVFVGVPGEPFTDIGRRIKLAGDFRLIMPVCLTNGAEGYFPTTDAYSEGGYEARSSIFRAGIAERLVEGAGKLMAKI